MNMICVHKTTHKITLPHAAIRSMCDAYIIVSNLLANQFIVHVVMHAVVFGLLKKCYNYYIYMQYSVMSTWGVKVTTYMGIVALQPCSKHQ